MIDNAKIGKRIGAGLQHIVHEYGDEEVIKFPRTWMRWSVTYEQKKRRLDIVREHFAEYMLETKVYPYEGSYCYIQKKVVLPEMLKLRQIREGMLDDIIAKNKHIVREHGMSIDVLGFQAVIEFVTGFLSGRVMPTGNIMLGDQAPKGLYLIDDDLIKTSPFAVEHPREVLFVLLSYIMYLANRLLLWMYRPS